MFVLHRSVSGWCPTPAGTGTPSQRAELTLTATKDRKKQAACSVWLFAGHTHCSEGEMFLPERKCCDGEVCFEEHTCSLHKPAVGGLQHSIPLSPTGMGTATHPATHISWSICDSCSPLPAAQAALQGLALPEQRMQGCSEMATGVAHVPCALPSWVPCILQRSLHTLLHSQPWQEPLWTQRGNFSEMTALPRPRAAWYCRAPELGTAADGLH